MDRPQQGEASQVIPNLVTVVVQVNVVRGEKMVPHSSHAASAATAQLA